MEEDLLQPTSLVFWAMILVGITVITWRINRNSVKIPGPRGLPYIGNLFQIISKNPLEILEEWRLEFGNIYHIKSMGQETVVVSGEEGLRESLISKSTDFAGRPQMFRWQQYVRHNFHISGSDYDNKWTVRKKAFINSLKMYGERLSTLESITQEILKGLADKLDDTKGQPTDIKDLLYNATADIMTSIVFGRLLDSEGLKELALIDREFPKLASPVGEGAELDIYPWLRFFGNKTYKRIMELSERSYNWFSKEITFNKKEHYVAGDPKCVLDAMLKYQENEKDDKGNFIITDGGLFIMMQEMIGAGTGTTSTTMYHLIAILAERQDIQERIHEEIDSVVASRVPCLADRKNAHLTEATILEVLRYTSIVPLLVPHKTTKDTTLCGYNIPCGVQIWNNVKQLHHSDEYWNEPFKFVPERFLDKNGQLVPSDHINRKRLLPFGAGRRVCPGEALAKNRLFLFVATLMQRFHFTPPEGVKMPTDPKEYNLGLIAEPDKYEVIVTMRHEN